jgi:hypothetical protein
VEVARGVKEVMATADGDQLQTRLTEQGDRSIALVDVLPNTKVVHIASIAR